MRLQIKFWHNNAALQFDTRNDLKEESLEINLHMQGVVVTFHDDGRAHIRIKKQPSSDIMVL